MSAEIFCTTWALYNEGHQFTNKNTGRWYKVADWEYSDIMEILKKAQIGLGMGDDIELLVSDYQEIPDSLYSEYISEETYEVIKKYDDLEEREQVAFSWLLDRGFKPEEAIDKVDRVQIDEEDPEDYAERYCDDCCYEIPPFIRSFVDFKEMGESFIRDGSIEEYDDYLITNVQEF